MIRSLMIIACSSVVLLSGIPTACAKDAALTPRTLDLSLTPSQAPLNPKHSMTTLPSPLNVHPKLDLRTEFIPRSAYTQPHSVKLSSELQDANETQGSDKNQSSNEKQNEQGTSALEPTPKRPLVTLKSRESLMPEKEAHSKKTSLVEPPQRSSDSQAPQTRSDDASPPKLSLDLSDTTVIVTPILEPIRINERSLSSDDTVISSPAVLHETEWGREEARIHQADVALSSEQVPEQVTEQASEALKQDPLDQHETVTLLDPTKALLQERRQHLKEDQSIAREKQQSVMVIHQRAISPLVQGMKEE